jgi:drug/metabolite transporter (DMT)-like permease
VVGLSAMQELRRTQPILGIGFKVASTLAFTVMATLVKLASDRYPIGELTFFRSAFAIVPVLAWAGARGRLPAALYTSHLGGHLGRSLAGTAAMMCGFTALALLPIADATAIGYAMPLFTVALATVILGEQVRLFRWSAVVVGLLGVLIILSDYAAAPDQPGRSAVGAAFAVAGAAFGAFAQIQVRVLTRYEGAATIVIYFSLFAALASLATLPFGWTPPTPADALVLALAGVCGGIGQVLLTQSFRFGEASTIAPFEYTSMVWALAVSLAVFGTWPTATVLAGTAVVVAAGLAVIYREHRLGIERARARRAETPTTPLS